MKSWLKLFPLTFLWLAAALAVRASPPSLSVVGIAAAPGSALPGASVTYTVSVNNGSTTQFGPGQTADFSLVLTNLVTGATISGTATNIGPTSGFIAAATTNPQTGQVTPGSGTFTFSLTLPQQTTEAGDYRALITMTGTTLGVSAIATGGLGGFAVNTSVLTVTGKPDLQITNLNYSAGTSYVGGTVIPMSLTYVNNQSTNGTANVPYTPGINGFPAFVRIQVVLSSNPTFGDADDFQLTILDIVPGNVASTNNAGYPAVLADGASHTFSWNQILPGNFSGSYYVLAKIDSLNQLPQNQPPALSVNGNPVWGGNTLNPSGTLINLLPSNFPIVYTASHASGAATTANGYSDNPSMTADGRYVAFASDASNLVSGDTNAARDIFYFDSQTGLVHRLSVSQQGVQGNGASNNPAISADGRYVAFESVATNLVIGDTNGFSDIFVVDTVTGLIARVSGANAVGGQANNPSFRPAISQDGRYIVFESTATNLTSPAPASGASHVYLYNRDVSNSGTFDTAGNTATKIIDVDATTPLTLAGNANAIQAKISEDGTWVAFASKATNLVLGGTTVGRQHVYVRPAANLGTATSGIKLVSVVNATGVQGNAASQTPSLSSDGHFVAFASLASNLVAGDTNGVSDIFVYDNTAPVGTPVVRRMSIPDPSTGFTEGTDPSAAGFQLGSINPTISADGRFVAFASLDDNLTAGDASGQYQTTDSNDALDIFVHDRDAGNTSATGAGVPANYDTVATSTALVSVNSFGYQTNGLLGIASTAASNIYPVISANGRFVAFPSDAENTAGLAFGATNLLPLDSNGLRDVFLFDRRTTASVTPPTPPTVTITNPGNGGTVLVNTPISVTASATTTIGVVSSVQFFVNGTSIGTSSVFPYAQTWTPVAVGTYTLSALVTDSFGNTGVSSNITVNVNAAPSVGLTSPVAGSTIALGATQTVTATASPTTPGATITGVQFFANGVSLGTDSTAPYSVSWTPASAGNYTLTAVATDSSGTQTTSPSVAVTVSSGPVTPPGVTITNPIAGSAYAVGSLINVSATASLGGAGVVAGVQFFANGVSIGTASSLPFSVVFTPTATGTYSLTAVATDSAGNQSTSTAVNISAVAGTPPAVTITSPVVGSTYAVASPIVISAMASLGTGLVTEVDFFVNGLGIAQISASNSGQAVNPNLFSYTWTPAAAGTYTFTAVATDTSHNQTTSTPVAVNVVAATPPTVAIVSPANNSTLPVNTPQNVTANASSGAASIIGVEFFANGLSVGSKSTYPFTVPWTPTSPGTYQFVAVAEDSLGVKSTSAPVTYTVTAGTAPTVAISSPASGATVLVGSTTEIDANATDDVAVAGVQFFVNGQAFGAFDSTFPYTIPFIPTSPGTFTVTAVATDNIGNQTTSAPITIKVIAGTPPTISFANPSAAVSLPLGNGLQVSVNASDSDGTVTQVQVFANGVLIPNGTLTVPPFTVNWVPTFAGAISLTAIATDNSGQSTTTAPVVVTVTSGTAPGVILASPANGSSFGIGTTISLSATTTASVTQVQFLVNGIPVSGSPKVGAPFNLTWTPTTTGTFTLTAIATNIAGVSTTSAATLVTIVGNNPPTVTLLSPPNGLTTSAGNAITLSADAGDTDGTVTSVRFFANGTVIATASSAPFSVSWTPTAQGSYTIYAQATDNSGNSTNSASRTITVAGNHPPVVSIQSPADGAFTTAGLPVTLIATASDPDGTVAQVRFLVNGIQLGTPLTSVTTQYNTTWTPAAGGTYSIIAEATDNLGAVTPSAPISVNVAPNFLPAVSITSPVNGATVQIGVPATITATAADADGSVASVQFFVNGVSIGIDTTEPFQVQWTPNSAGLYRIVAVATDNVGAVTTSDTVLVMGSAVSADTIFTGTYQGSGEVGYFSVIAATGKTATFIAYSTTAGANKTYFYPGMAVDVSGGYSLSDSSNNVLISGTVSPSGTSGTFDNGRLTFIGVNTEFFPASSAVASGYYTGKLTSSTSSTLAAIVGTDGSIMLYAANGSFNDAGGGPVSKVDSTGAFNVPTIHGNHFTGKVDPVSRLLTGSLSGSNGGAFTGAPSALSAGGGQKVAGSGQEVLSNVYVAANHNTFDQVLLTGPTASVTADPGQITRISYVDLSNDIVQVEFSGAGRLAISLDNASGPAVAVNYNQPDVSYMKGHAGIVITGADETTNVAVFSVGRMTAVNQTLFKSGVNYDGVADIAYIAILSNDGKFGGVRTANADYVASQGIVGICAPGVQFTGPVYVGDINASNTASPQLILGSAADVRITGGDLWQPNGTAVQISGISQLKFVDGTTSQGTLQPAQADRSPLQQDGADVTAKVVVNPGK